MKLGDVALSSLAGRKPDDRQNHHQSVDGQRPETPRIRAGRSDDRKVDRADDRGEQDDPDREDDEERV